MPALARAIPWRYNGRPATHPARAMRYFEETEQLARARRWLAEHGRHLALGVGLALFCYLAIWLWLDHRRAEALRAAELYPLYQQAVALAVPGASDFDERAEQAGDLVQQLRARGSLYAALASADLARLHAESGDAQRAAELMQWAHDHASDSGLRQLFALRLARILSSLGRHQDALELLDDPDVSFASRYNEVRGDILLANGSWNEAAAAYQAVLGADNSADNEYMRLKLQHARQQAQSEEAAPSAEATTPPDAG